MSFGFTYIDVEERPKCLICMEILAADCMKLNNYRDILKQCTLNMLGKPEFFHRQLNELNK
jgi:hypothetical protein